MKRTLFALALVCLATGGFAEGWSAGLGASASSFKYEIKSAEGGTLTGVPFNLVGYVESTYLQLAMGYRMIDGFHIDAGEGAQDVSWKFAYLSFAAFGKFPIRLGFFTVIPMAGVEYDIMLHGEDFDGTFSKQVRSDWNSLWIKAGVGAEVPITAVVYVRPEVLVGYQLNNQFDKKQIDDAKAQGVSDISIKIVELQVSVLVGIKL
jgi:hypothetical protein